MTRMFVAVIPPDEVLEDLEAFVSPRRGAVPFRWTDPEQWHLTLAFSHGVPDRSYDDLVDRLARRAQAQPDQARILGAVPSPTSGGPRSSTPASRPTVRSWAGWRPARGQRSRRPVPRSTGIASRRT